MGKGLISAGVVVVRGQGSQRAVLSVHRPKLQDWSLPKGHPEGDELLPAAAVREFTEETGLQLQGLSVPLGAIEYSLGGATKRVHWWLGRLDTDAPRGDVLNKNEVDKVRWARAATASRQLSYVDELPIVQRALETPASVPLIVVRHAKAIDRAAWSGKRDADRDLSERGRAQAAALVGLLRSYNPVRIVSSSSERCLATVRPYAAATGRAIEGLDALSEQGAAGDPKRVRTLMDALRDRVVATRAPLVVCGHRPVLGAMVTRLGVAYEAPLKPAEVMVVHLDVANGAVLAVERFRSPK